MAKKKTQAEIDALMDAAGDEFLRQAEAAKGGPKPRQEPIKKGYVPRNLPPADKLSPADDTLENQAARRAASTTAAQSRRAEDLAAFVARGGAAPASAVPATVRLGSKGELEAFLINNSDFKGVNGANLTPTEAFKLNRILAKLSATAKENQKVNKTTYQVELDKELSRFGDPELTRVTNELDKAIKTPADQARFKEFVRQGKATVETGSVTASTKEGFAEPKITKAEDVAPMVRQTAPVVPSVSPEATLGIEEVDDFRAEAQRLGVDPDKFLKGRKGVRQLNQLPATDLTRSQMRQFLESQSRTGGAQHISAVQRRFDASQAKLTPEQKALQAEGAAEEAAAKAAQIEQFQTAPKGTLAHENLRRHNFAAAQSKAPKGAPNKGLPKSSPYYNLSQVRTTQVEFARAKEVLAADEALDKAIGGRPKTPLADQLKVAADNLRNARTKPDIQRSVNQLQSTHQAIFTAGKLRGGVLDLERTKEVAKAAAAERSIAARGETLGTALEPKEFKRTKKRLFSDIRKLTGVKTVSQFKKLMAENGIPIDARNAKNQGELLKILREGDLEQLEDLIVARRAENLAKGKGAAGAKEAAEEAVRQRNMAPERRAASLLDTAAPSAAAAATGPGDRVASLLDVPDETAPDLRPMPSAAAPARTASATSAVSLLDVGEAAPDAAAAAPAGRNLSTPSAAGVLPTKKVMTPLTRKARKLPENIARTAALRARLIAEGKTDAELLKYISERRSGRVLNTVAGISPEMDFEVENFFKGKGVASAVPVPTAAVPAVPTATPVPAPPAPPAPAVPTAAVPAVPAAAARTGRQWKGTKSPEGLAKRAARIGGRVGKAAGLMRFLGPLAAAYGVYEIASALKGMTMDKAEDRQLRVLEALSAVGGGAARDMQNQQMLAQQSQMVNMAGIDRQRQLDGMRRQYSDNTAMDDLIRGNRDLLQSLSQPSQPDLMELMARM